jgi:hypothetical protein
MRTLMILAACAGLIPGQERSVWSLDSASAIAHLWNGSGGLIGWTLLGGNPFQIRADGHGRAVVPDAAAPRIWLLDPGQAQSVQLDRPPRDAVCDGAGGAWVLLSDVRGYRLVQVSPAGAVSTPLSGPETPLRVRCGPESTIWLSLVDAQGAAIVRVHDAQSLELRALWQGARPVSDIVFAEAGRVLLVGGATSGIPVVDGMACETGLLPAAFPVVAACPLAGGALAVAEGWPTSIRVIPCAGPAPLPVTVPGAGCLEGTPSGEVLVHLPGQFLAYRFHPRHGLVAFVPWPTDWARSDGAGMQHLRTEAGDPDGDGFATADELWYGSDPASPVSVPAALSQAGPWLEIWAPELPGAPVQIRVEGGAEAPRGAGPWLPLPLPPGLSLDWNGHLALPVLGPEAAGRRIEVFLADPASPRGGLRLPGFILAAP